MIRYLIIIVFFSFIINEISAQQELLFTNDRYNMLSFNPSIVGAFDDDKTYAIANLAYRNQWLGFEGAPTTINAGAEYFLEDSNVGLGMTLFNDRIGVDSKLEIAGNYAYQIKTRDGIISGGLRTAFTQIRSDFTKVQNVDSGDLYDDQLENISVFSVGLGFMYIEEDLKLGIAVPSVVAFSSSSRFKDFKERHLYVNASFKLGDYTDDFRFEPSVLFKFQESVPIQAKIGLFGYINNNIIPGIHYRTDDAVAFSLGLKLQDQFDIALAYDWTLSKIRQVSNNTLELFLGYRFQ